MRGKTARERREREPPPPLDAEALDTLAVRYVGKYATTRAKLAQYLTRKVRERGWAGGDAPRLDALADRLVALGYIDDAMFAAARGRAGAARGHGARRIADTLRHDGVEADVAAPVLAAVDALASAVAFARRKRLGPWGPPAVDPKARHRQLAAMARAGHGFDIARRVLGAADADAAEALIDE